MEACKAINHDKEIIFRKFYLSHGKLGKNRFDIFSATKLKAMEFSVYFSYPHSFVSYHPLIPSVLMTRKDPFRRTVLLTLDCGNLQSEAFHCTYGTF